MIGIRYDQYCTNVYAFHMQIKKLMHILRHVFDLICNCSVWYCLCTDSVIF